MGEFTINGAENMAFVSSVEQLRFRPTHYLPDSEHTVIQCETGYCVFQEWQGPSYTVWLSDYPTQEKVTLYGAIDRRLIELQFMLGDGADHVMNGLGNIQVPSCSMNLYHEPYVENKVYLAKGSKMITFDVHLRPEDLLELCSCIPGLGDFYKKVERGQFAALLKQAIPASPDLLSNIQAILHTPSRPGLQNRILQPLVEALVFNALCYLTGNRLGPIKTDSRERKAITDLSQHLKTKLDSDLTIEELSKIYLINTQKLKALFKEAYGVPIHQYAIRERMQTACLLLRETDASIQEIAFSVGYHTPSAFTEKFKEAFFLNPLQYRKLAKKR